MGAGWLVVGVGLGSCGGTFYGDVPLGWRGTIPTCDGAQVASGAALRREDTGFLVAERAGRATLRCADGSQTDVGVRRAVRLELDGPATLTIDGHAGYRVKAFADDGDELRFGDPMLDAVAWTTSWPAPDAEAARAYCHEPLFSCPDSDFARLTVRRAGTVTLTAAFAGLTVSRDVVVAP